MQISDQTGADDGGEIEGQLCRREQFVTRGQRLSQLADGILGGGAAFGQ